MMADPRGVSPFCVSLALAVLSASFDAHAQDKAKPPPGDVAAAEALFRQARDLLQAGKVAEACPKFAESYRLDPGIGALANLASCHEKEGKIASAWGEYSAVIQEAQRTNDPQRMAFAKKQITALAPRVPKVTFNLKGTAPEGFKLSRDGVDVGVASLGTPLPIDPGAHALEASAPGYRPAHIDFEIGEGKTKTIAIPSLEKAPDEPARPDRPVAPPQASSRRSVGFVIAGIGVAGLALGGVFVGLTAAKKSDADAQCPAKRCTPEGTELINSAKTNAWIADIGIGAGAALTVLGGVLVITGGPKERKPQASTGHVVVKLAPMGSGVQAFGTF
jgi:hypothetical protein